MGSSLPRYLQLKVHQLIDSSSWKRIIVTGRHQRSFPALTFSKEKKDKPFNWMRPTAQLVNDDLNIMCFPGDDHVAHYAALIAAHLEITRGPDEAQKVLYKPCTPEDTQLALKSDTNLTQIPQAEVIVFGLVHRLSPLMNGETFSQDQDEFAWQVVTQPGSGLRVAFVGCRLSFWGSISGDLVRIATELTGAKTVLYVGKLGTTIPSIRPNRYLASGDWSLVQGQPVRWNNILQKTIDAHTNEEVIKGRHETLPSVLFETKDWLEGARTRNSDFVDPEVGCMAKAALERDVNFGYLHVISDNVAAKYAEDLSNERDDGVLHGRQRLYGLINHVLGKYLRSL